MKKGFFSKSNVVTSTSSDAPAAVSASPNPQLSKVSTIALKATNLITSSYLPFETFPTAPPDASTLHWSFFPPTPAPSMTSPSASCIFLTTTQTRLLFSHTTYFTNPTPLPSLVEPLYEISNIKGKGKGLIARCDLPAHSYILSDRPVLVYDSKRGPPRHLLNTVLEHALAHLQPELQSRFLGLFNAWAGKESSIGILGRAETNAVPIVEFKEDTTTYHGVFPVYSRVNHSCCPNTLPEWDSDGFRMRLKTTRNVRKGEELTGCYIVPFQQRKERKFELLVKVRFFSSIFPSLPNMFLLFFYCVSFVIPAILFRNSTV